MRVFLSDAANQPRFLLLRRRHGIDKRGQNAHMGKVKNIAFTDGGKAFHGEHDDLRHRIDIDISNTFKPGLHNLLEGVRAARDAIDVFVVINLLRHAGLVFGIFDDGKRDIRL